MKLHLPKRLFTALLTAITLAAAPAALTLGSAAWGAAQFTTSTEGEGENEITTATYSGTANDMQFSGIGNDVDKLILNTSGGWLTNTTLGADVLVQIGADGNNGTTGLVLTDGGGSTYTIANKVVGSGLIKKTGPGRDMVLQFTGDVSEYTGNVELNSGYTFTLWFGGADISAVSSETNGASGTGTITFAQDSGKEHILKYSYASSETPIYITNEIVTTGAGTSKITIENGADYIFTKSVDVTKLDITAGSLTLRNEVSANTLTMTGSSVLTVEQGAKLTATEIKSEGAANTERSIFVNEGASVTTGTLWIAYNMGSVDVDGELTVNNELKFATQNTNNSESLLTGEGSVSAQAINATNYGSYGIDVNTLTVGRDGIAISQNSVLNLAAATTTVSGIVTIDSGSTLNVNSGNVTMNKNLTGEGTLALNSGSLTLNGERNSIGSFAYAGGTLNYSTLTAGAVNISGASPLSNSGHLTVTGTLAGIIENTAAGKVTLASGMSIAADTNASITGAGITEFGGTLTNNGTLTLGGKISLSGDIYRHYVVREAAGETGLYSLSYTDTSVTNEDGNGFKLTSGGSYWLVQGGTTILNNVTSLEGYTITQVTDNNAEPGERVGDVYIYSASYVGREFYISSGSVDVGTGVQAAATGYTLQGGRMEITGGSVSASAITCDSSAYTDGVTTGIITVGAGAELLLDTMPGGASLLNLLKGEGMVNDKSAGRLVVTTAQNLGGSPETTYKGKLEIVGARLSIGSAQGDTNKLSSLSEIILNDGGNIFYNGKDDGETSVMDFQKITVESGTGEFHLEDSGGTGSSNNTIQFGEIAVAAGALMQLTSRWQDSAYYVDKLTGAGTFNASSATDSGNNKVLTVNNLAGFSGDLVFTNARAGFDTLTVNTGGSEVSFRSLSAVNLAAFVLNVQADTTIGSLTAATGTVNIISDGKTLTLGGGTDAENPVTHNIGTLSAAAAGVTLGNHATLTLGAGTADAQKQHSIGTLSAANAGVTLGDHATLALGDGTHSIGTLSAASAGVSLGNHATLSLGDGTHSIGTLSGNTGSKLNLAENAVLNQLGSVTSPVTVTGSGTYIMGNTGNTNLTGWTEGTWTGTVVVDGMSITGKTEDVNDLSKLGNAGSTIKLSGVSGWITSTQASNLILENGTHDFGLKIINGSTDGKYYFNGIISGSGDLEYNLGASNSHNFYFTKDISQWAAEGEETPEIRVNSSNTLTVYLQDKANTVNVAFVQNKGTLNLNVGTTATFNEDVTVTGLTLNQSATFNKTLSASTIALTSGKVLELAGAEDYTLSAAITGNGVLTKSGTSSITLTGAISNAFENLNVENGTLTLNSGIGSNKISNATINGKLIVNQGDAINYDATNSISVNGGTLELNDRQTVDSDNSFSLTNGTISGTGGHYSPGGVYAYTAGLELHNASTLNITSSGISSISTAIGMRNASGKTAFAVTDGALSVSGGIVGYGSIEKSGAGLLTLSGANTYAGTTSITEGRLVLGANGSLSSPEISISQGAIFEIATTADTTTLNTVSGAGQLIHSGSSATTIASAQNLAGGINVTGGSLTITSAQNLAGGINVTGGSLAINSLLVSGTISVNKADGASLSFTSVTVDELNNHLTLQPGAEASYKFSEDGVNETTNGFRSSSATYILFDGYQWKNGTVAGYEVSVEEEENQTLITSQGAYGTVYYVNKGTYTDSDSSNGATAYYIASGANLVLKSKPQSISDRDILAGFVAAEEGSDTAKLTIGINNLVTGEANYTTTYSGVLELAKGITFTFGSTANGKEGTDVNTRSLAGVELNSGSVLQYQGSATNAVFKNLTVNAAVSENDPGATFKIVDIPISTTIAFTGVTTLENDLTILSNYGGMVNIENLSGSGTLSSTGSHNTEAFTTTIESLAGFTGSLSFTDADHTVEVSTGTEDVSFKSLSAEGVESFRFDAQAGSTTIGEISASSGTVNVAKNKNLNLGIGTDAQASSHSIGTLNAEMGSVSLAADDSLSLGGGVTHSVGTLSMGAGASVSLGENATLKLVNTLPSSHGVYDNQGNSDPAASLDLTIQGAAGSMLSLALNTDTSWDTNDTIKLRPLTADGGTVESVYIRAGALANAVYHDGGAVTDLGGANLTMAGNTKLVLRKALAENTNFGAGTITLEGTTDMVLYGSNAYTISNRIEGVNGILNITGDNASSITFTNVLQLNTLTSNKNVTLGGGTERNPLEHTISNLTATGGKLNLAEHAVLNTITNASGVTLTGSGTYKLASGTMTMTSGVTLGADWTGAVRLSGEINNLDLAGSLYNEASWVEFAGVTGYLKQGSNTYGANIRLTDIGENAAITLNNGWNSNIHTFSGKIEGEGTWKRTNSGGTEQNYVFAGDVAGWTGAFVNAIPAMHKGTTPTATNLTFQGASAINVDISNPGADAEDVGSLNVTINDTAQRENKSAVAVNGSIQATKLTVDTSVSADFSNTVDVDTLVVNSGKTATFNNTATAGTVTNSGQIKLGETATITGKQGAAATMSKVQMSSAGISGSPAQDGSSSIRNADIEIAQLAQDATFTIADMTLTNTSINAATVNTQVSFDNVTVSGAVVLKNLKVAMSDVQVGAGGSEGSMGKFKGSTTLLSGITMSAGSSLTVDLGDLSSYAAMGPGKYDLSITLSGFSMDAYTGDYAGSALQFAAGSWLSELLAQDNNANVQISISQAEEGAAAAAGAGSGSTGVSYSTGNVGMVITITGLNVPEPTTATLSLLALAALAGRRRRK